MSSSNTIVVPESFQSKDLYAPDVIENPYPYYDALRNKPIQFGLEDYPPGTVPGYDTPYPAWVVLKYSDVIEVCGKPGIFSSRDIMQEESETPTLMLVNHDDPRHAELRSIARVAFSPRLVNEKIAPEMERIVKRILDEAGDGEVDVMENIAPNLPAMVMTILIGTPEEDFVLLRRWANAFMVTSDFTIEERQQCNVDLWNYYDAAVQERYADYDAGKDLPDDLMTAFIRAESDAGKLTKDEVVRFCITLVVAGAETTGYLLGNLIHTFLELPHLFGELREDRSLIAPFIEESARRDGPIQRLHRVCTQDTEIAGTKIKEGDWVAVFFAAANRDPDVWENPHEFILNRPNIGRHVTFSYGIHHCMGSGLARNEASTLLNEILDRYSSIEPGSAGPVRQRGGLLNYGLESCPVRFIK